MTATSTELINELDRTLQKLHSILQSAEKKHLDVTHLRASIKEMVDFRNLVVPPPPIRADKTEPKKEKKSKKKRKQKETLVSQINLDIRPRKLILLTYCKKCKVKRHDNWEYTKKDGKAIILCEVCRGPIQDHKYGKVDMLEHAYQGGAVRSR